MIATGDAFYTSWTSAYLLLDCENSRVHPNMSNVYTRFIVSVFNVRLCRNIREHQISRKLVNWVFISVELLDAII